MAEREEARRKRDRQKAAQLRYYYCYGAGVGISARTFTNAGAMYKKLEFAKKSKPEGEKKKDPATKKGGGDEKDSKKQDDKKDEKKDEGPPNRPFGQLPRMAMRFLGSNLSEAFCEQVIAAANNIMTEGRTLLGEDYLEMLCVLRMNRDFMRHMRTNYEDVAMKAVLAH